MEKLKSRWTDKYLVTDKSFYKKVLTILLPVVLQSLVNQGVNMMDTIMVGSFGEATISGSSLANQYYSLFSFLCMGISAAGLVLAAQYWGSGDVKAVRRVFDLMLQIVILSGFAFSVITFVIPDEIMSIYSNEEDVISEGAKYLKVTAFIFLPHGISLVLTNVIRAIGNAKLGLITSVISFFVNVFFNWVFIFGKLGVPAMGIAGAALGTLCARVVEVAACAVYMMKYEKQLNYKLSGLIKLPSKAMFREFVRLGLPALISDFILALAASATSMILGRMGKEVVSAYAIVTVLDRMCTVAISGVASAAGVVIGQTVGSGDEKQAQRQGYTFLILSIGIGIVGGLLVLLVGTWSIGLYDIAPSTVLITQEMMDMSAIIVFFQSIQSAMSKGILRGGGDTRFLMIADVLFQWCLSIPLGYLVGIVLGWAPYWALLALRIDYVIKAVWLVWRLRSGKWIHRARKIEA